MSRGCLNRVACLGVSMPKCPSYRVHPHQARNSRVMDGYLARLTLRATSSNSEPEDGGYVAEDVLAVGGVGA